MNERETLETQDGVLQDYIPKLPSHFLDASFVLLGNQHPQLQLEVLDQFVAPPSLIVSDTMNYWIDHSFEQLREVIQKTDVLTVSDQEAFAITQEKVLLKAVEKLQQMGATYIIIKRGEHGAMLFHEDKSFYTPALPLCKVCDPTGAGDTFAGGFVGYMAQTGDISFENMKNGLVYATVLASFCVEEVGASKLLTINKEEVLRRLFSLKELTQFDIKDGTPFYAIHKMYLLLEKQHNRGQDGAGIATVKLQMQPGERYIARVRSNDAQPIQDIFKQINQHINDLLEKNPTLKGDIDQLKRIVPYLGEVYLAGQIYTVNEKDSSGNSRKVYKFPLALINQEQLIEDKDI